MDFAQESAAKLQDGQAFQVVNSPGVFRSGRYAIAGHPLSVWQWVFPYHPCVVYICLYIYQQKSTKSKYTYIYHTFMVWDTFVKHFEASLDFAMTIVTSAGQNRPT